MGPSDRILVSALAIAVTGIAVSSMRFDFTGANAPEWAQAIGTILALGIAIAVPAFEQSRRRREAIVDRRARTRNFLLAMGGHLFGVVHSLSHQYELIQALKHRLPVVGNPIDHIRTLYIQVPSQLEAAIVASFDLDPQLMEPVQNLLMGVAGYNNFTRQMEERWPFDPAVWPTLMKVHERSCLLLSETAQRVVNSYQPRP